MVLTPVLHRTGLIVLRLHTANGRIRGWRRDSRVTPEILRPAALRRRPAPVAPQSFWDADDGEPTWEDAEWQ